MKLALWAAAVWLPILVACEGGVVDVTSATAMHRQLSQPRAQVETYGAETEQPQPLSTPSTADLLYVGNVGNNSITVYRHDTSGNTAPLKVIIGSRTSIDSPGQLSEDPQGNLYVANGSYYKESSNPSILVFAHGASGNVSPIRKLNVATGLSRIDAITVDQHTGKIFAVEDNNANPRITALLRYAPNAAGNASPLARGSATFPALQLASDSTGAFLIEAHDGISPSAGGFGVETLVKQFSNNTPATILYDISYFRAVGVADDPTTTTYLAMMDDTSNAGIYRLSEKTMGAGPNSPGETLTPVPVSVITNESCGTQLALGYLRNIYVVHSANTFSKCPRDAIYVYKNDATGDVLPLRVLSGDATKLDEPYGIYEGQ